MFSRAGLPSLLSCLTRIVLAVIFLYGGIPKFFSIQDFAVVISAYGLVPDQLVLVVAVFLPIFEIITAVGLLLNHRWALAAAALLLVIFIGVLSYGLYLGLDIECGCFGAEDPGHDSMSNLAEARLRDLILLVAVGYSWRYSRVRIIKQ